MVNKTFLRPSAPDWVAAQIGESAVLPHAYANNKMGQSRIRYYEDLVLRRCLDQVLNSIGLNGIVSA
jgi:hypothetical protein